ncbi:MAG: 16S rRNA (guanine(966)-N(2))-methyltransferase RsmD [Solirubrobacterales bacterium]
MRVVAGEFKGRRLIGPKGSDARPTSDKVREAIFSMLGPLNGERVLDLFAGTGALGIEALSRGASSATFVERDSKALAIVRKNLGEIIDDVDRATVMRGDSLRALSRLQDDSMDLVFVDPPYADAAELEPVLAQALPRVLAADGVVVTECDRRSPIALDATTQEVGQKPLIQRVERKYGDTLIRIYGSQ